MSTDSDASGGRGRQRATRSDRRYLTVPEAAALLRVTPEWVRAEVRAGRLSHYRIGRRVRFSREMIQEYLDERLVPALDAPVARRDHPRDAGSRGRGPAEVPPRRLFPDEGE